MILLAVVAALLAPTPVGVGEREWRISLYRSRVPAGVVHLNARNFGEDGHDLSVRTRAGKVLKSLPELDPGDTGTLRVRLRNLAALISKPLGIRVAHVEADGDFDTHDNQSELTRILADVSQSLAAFQADLEARGVADRTLTFVWSEFGRRPEENDSGTDHGAGGLAWVQGNRALAGVHSDYPDLNRLDREDNLQVTIDFRRVYSSLLEQHLGTQASAVIPRAGKFGRVQLVR